MDEVAAATEFLLANTGIHGQDLTIDGGLLVTWPQAVRLGSAGLARPAALKAAGQRLGGAFWPGGGQRSKVGGQRGVELAARARLLLAVQR